MEEGETDPPDGGEQLDDFKKNHQLLRARVAGSSAVSIAFMVLLLSPPVGSNHHGYVQREKAALLLRIDKFVNQDSFSRITTLGHILLLDPKKKPDRWDRLESSSEREKNEVLIWSDRRGQTGLRSLTFHYQTVEGSVYGAYNEIEFELSGSPCITYSDLAQTLGATIDYRQILGRPEQWNPAPRSYDSNDIVGMSLKEEGFNRTVEFYDFSSQLGNDNINRNMIVDPNKCIRRFTISAGQSILFVDEPT